MQRDQPKRLSVDAQTHEYAGMPGLFHVKAQRIDHDITHQMNPLWRNTLRPEVEPAAFLGHQENVRDGVRHHPIDLLWHGAVETA